MSEHEIGYLGDDEELVPGGLVIEDITISPVRVKIKLLPGGRMPERKTKGASGWDLYPRVVDCGLRILKSSSSMLVVSAGFCLDVPSGYEAQIRPRSGMAVSGSAAVLGTVDSDYRGEVGVILPLRTVIRPGDRIAQMVIARVPEVELVQVDELSDTERGSSGFGGTGR